MSLGVPRRRSLLVYTTCSASEPLQQWSVAEPRAGTGTIVAADGRCITVQGASVATPWTQAGVTYGVAVLDHCGGAASQWTAATVGTNTGYQTAVEKDTKCWLLNVVGDTPDVQNCEVAVWNMAGASTTCPTTPSLNSEFSYDPTMRQMKIIASDRVAKTCPGAIYAKPDGFHSNT